VAAGAGAAGAVEAGLGHLLLVQLRLAHPPAFMVWCGVAWFGVVWFGLVWCGVVWVAGI